MIPFVKSISSSSPLVIPLISSSSTIGKPMFIAFLKKILAKEGAITHLIPANFNATGACSLLEPLPKFLPATMIEPAGVAAVGQRQVADAEVVGRPQHGQGILDRVAAFHAHQ